MAAVRTSCSSSTYSRKSPLRPMSDTGSHRDTGKDRSAICAPHCRVMTHCLQDHPWQV